MSETRNSELALQAMNELKKIGGFDISVCDTIPNIDDNPKFKKLSMTSEHKMQMSALAGQFPALLGSAATAKAASSANTLYLVNCPLGIENTLVQMKNGNWSNFIHNGLHFDGYAPMFPVNVSVPTAMTTAATVAGTLSVMSVAVGQYYLTQINGELKSIQQGMDKILEFLYGDKKAELMSEVSFAKYAYENYEAIMAQGYQKQATITSLQQSKKVAMKDSEFYISDLGAALRDSLDIEAIVDKACSIHESLDLALQLGVMSSILEVYYSQNFNQEYLKYIERDLSLYIDKCDKFVLSVFSKLHERVETYKGTPLKKVNKNQLLDKISEVLEPLKNGDESTLKQSLRSGLYSVSKGSVYYIKGDGSVYIKTA